MITHEIIATNSGGHFTLGAGYESRGGGCPDVLTARIGWNAKMKGSFSAVLSAALAG